MENSAFLQERLLVCLGNEYRQDDGVGPFIGRQLKLKGFPGLRIMENAGDGMAMMDAWKDEETVILVDAVHSGQPAGTIFCFDAVADPMPEDIFAVSSHDVSIPECIALSRSLGIFPEKLIFYGIEGESFEQGVHLSAAVKEAANEVLEMIGEELQKSNHNCA
jgi:hydrogenase maturation protease